MRFLFECVTCSSMINPSSSTEEPLSPPTPRTEETSSLVSSGPTVNNHHLRKRVPTRGSSADWKPSLFAISEDNAVSATLQKPVNRQPVSKVVSQRNVKRCGSSSVEVHASSRSHDFGREPLPMVFPAFTAAPFMF